MTDDLWATGEFSLRVRGAGTGWGRANQIRRPFAVIGRIAGVDVRIDDHAVSARHAYLHLDHRGLFTVDLATRTGTRVGDEGRSAGWLQVGEVIEIAGHRIELVDLQITSPQPDQPPPPSDTTAPRESADPLADAGSAPLVRVTLHPNHEPQTPLLLNSELVFLGRSAACGVRVEGASASRTHCVLVRTATAAYAVDLIGRGTWLNGHPLQGAARIADGDALMIGAARFECHVEPAPTSTTLEHAPSVPATVWPTELLPTGPPPLPPGLIPPESQAALLAWMMNLIQASHNEMVRRQGEFQRDLARLVAQIHRDNSHVLNKHLERVESIHHELSALRDEIRHRFGPTEPPARPVAAPTLNTPKLPPLQITPTNPPDNPATAAAWLIHRVNQLDQENRSSWKDLLSRISGRKE